MKVGFVSIFGKPNAGKSTLLNALMDEKLAIVSHKAQTTRHRIKGILNGPDYQIVFSDTPGLLEPKYLLQEKMMKVVSEAREDADLALLVIDVQDDLSSVLALFKPLRLQCPCIAVLTKIDQAKAALVAERVEFVKQEGACKGVVAVSALKKQGMEKLLETILNLLPEGEPYFDTQDLTDLPTKFFVAELIREKIFELFQEEIPYNTTVVVREFQEKTTLVKIAADIIVQRESQKGILLGEGGRMIRQLGTLSREEIEKFIGRKVFLELLVKVQPKWRDSDRLLKELGYL
ncbi:MAG: GTPase Era [Chitinophagaceae bacterium]